MHMDAIEEIYNRLIARNYHEVLYTDLQNVQQSNWGATANCPLHEDESSSFSFSLDKPLWFCSGGCGGGDWISYLMKKENLSFSEASAKLAKEAGIDLDELDSDDWKESSILGNMLEDAHSYFKTQLFTEKGKSALDFLMSRKYSQEEIERMELGFCPSPYELENHLLELGHVSTQIEESGLKSGHIGESHVIMIPYRDSLGRIKGFISRAIKEVERPLLDYEVSTGVEKDFLFNLQAAQSRDTIIIVKDYLDALIATTRDIPGVIASGSSILTREQVESVAKLGVHYVIVAFDNNDDGRDGTEFSLSLLSRKGIKSFVAELPLEYLTLGILLRENENKGTELFKEAINKATSGASWRAGHLLRKFDTATDRGRQQAFDNALEFEETLKDPAESRDFLEALAQGLGISFDLLAPWVKDQRRRKLEKNIRNSFVALFREGEKIVRDSTISTLQKYLDEASRDLKIACYEAKIKPPLHLPDYLKDKFEREKDRGSSLLGYQLIRFKKFAERIDGIQPGLYVVAASPNTGKTAFLTNLFLDILSSNSRTKGMYFTFDDTLDTIINRFLGVMTEVPLNRVQRQQESGSERNKIKAAYGHLIYLARNERLIVKDLSEINHMDLLEMEIHENVDEHLFICIDGIMNLDTRKYYGGLFQETVDRISRLKVLADTYRIPIITTSEVRRQINPGKNWHFSLDDLKDAGKFAYNASLIWQLLPENAKEFREKDEPSVLLSFEKNKLSPFKGTHKFTFKKLSGFMVEERDSEW